MKIFAVNKRAKFDYQILETFEAGLVLQGQEVKSIKTGRVSLTGSYVMFKEGELWLVGSQIPAYQPKNAPDDYNPERSRKLLLKKDEIKSLLGKSKQKGLTLVPIKLYNNRGKIKLSFASAKGRKKQDKRELIKKRDVEKEIRRALKE